MLYLHPRLLVHRMRLLLRCMHTIHMFKEEAYPGASRFIIATSTNYKFSNNNALDASGKLLYDADLLLVLTFSGHSWWCCIAFTPAGLMRRSRIVCCLTSLCPSFSWNLDARIIYTNIKYTIHYIRYSARAFGKKILERKNHARVLTKQPENTPPLRQS